MSHFTSVKTKLYEEATLVEVLTEMGYKVSYWKSLENTWGMTKRVDFQIDIPASDNIGFVKKAGERTFDIVVDWGGIHGIKRREFMQKLMQEYSKKIVRRQARAMGYQIEQKKNKKDNTIRLVLRKY